MSLAFLRGVGKKIKKQANYSTASAPEPFTLSTYNKTKNWDGTLYYSTDEVTWNEWDGTTTLSSAEHNGEHRLYVRGVGNSYITGSDDYDKRWVLSGSNVQWDDNIENLLDYETVAKGEHPVMAPYCFAYLFCDCTALKSAPALPATTLAQYCYYGMFDGCLYLKTAPKLPATIMAKYCYSHMFINCFGLEAAPELPATVLADFCYESMFSCCHTLTVTPELPATTLAYYCYAWMFESCARLTSVTSLPATNLADECYYKMFFNCKKLTTIPELPATTLAYHCYACMFMNCTSLVTLPKLFATELSNVCYRQMFEGCTNIKLSTTQTDEYPNEYRIPASGTGTSGRNSVLDMFTSTGGTFTGTPSINTTYYTANEVV